MSETVGRPRRSLPRRVGRLAAPVAIFSIVYFGVLIYAPLRLATLLFPIWAPGTPELLVLIVGPILGRVAHELRPSPATRRLAAASLTWLGCAFLLWLLLMPFELLALVVDPDPREAGVLIAAIWTALCIVALVGAQRLEIRHLTLPAPTLTRAARLVQISDVHIGSRAGAFLDRVVERLLPLRPDVVLITGDLVDFGRVPAAELAALARIEAPVFFCIGNHERYVDCDAICARLERHGVRVLRDAVDVSLGGFVLVGIDDAERRTRVREGLAQLAPLPLGYRILLYHRPDGLEDAAAAGIDLMLCGHTHAGQIMPFGYLVRRFFPRIQGLYQVEATRLYVSPGTGTWGPVMRLGTSNEITCIDLQPASD
ncbi:MAG: metallophosphoesterase [Pseudomonadales bacterium]|jgi:predicted MPP superfamily phosphohydrolase|nr:metallophosphoesterase [Pseudomonadales bacterium]